MHGLTGVTGNVYFCDFEAIQREHARAGPLSGSFPGTALEGLPAGAALLLAQIHASAEEIAATGVELTRQARERSRSLVAGQIQDIVSCAGTPAGKWPHANADETIEKMLNASAASGELRALLREQVSQGRAATQGIADIARRAGLNGGHAA
jgi:hypothetical protein